MPYCSLGRILRFHRNRLIVFTISCNARQRAGAMPTDLLLSLRGSPCTWARTRDKPALVGRVRCFLPALELLDRRRNEVLVLPVRPVEDVHPRGLVLPRHKRTDGEAHRRRSTTASSLVRTVRQALVAHNVVRFVALLREAQATSRRPSAGITHSTASTTQSSRSRRTAPDVPQPGHHACLPAAPASSSDTGSRACPSLERQTHRQQAGSRFRPFLECVFSRQASRLSLAQVVVARHARHHAHAVWSEHGTQRADEPRRASRSRPHLRELRMHKQHGTRLHTKVVKLSDKLRSRN